MPDNTPPIDIGVLTIKDEEFRAVLAAFPKKAGVHRGKREYTLRFADTAGGRYVVAVLRQIEQGNGEAQSAARDMLEDLGPSLVLVVGIAGGLPSDDVTLGDVVISTRVNDYSVEARKSQSKPTYSLSGGPIAKALEARIANLAGREAELGRWTAKLPARPPVQWNRAGALYGPKAWKTEVKQKLRSHFGPDATKRVPRFVAGTIASSDKLVKDPKVLFPWIETARHLVAIEMESGGVYRAARDRCLMLAIRGISDIVGFKRDEAWTKYACASAAAFAAAFLKTRPVDPKVSVESTQATGEGSRKSAPELDTLFANLVPLTSYPATIYVAPATVATYAQAWARLRDGAKGYIPRAWLLHNKNVYSFVNPASGHLAKIIDAGCIEAHSAEPWASAADLDKRRTFVHLLNAALCDDLSIYRVWFASDDKVYFFAGRLDDAPRRHRYQNLRQWSTITVVTKYEHESSTGKKSTYLRHLAFDGRFRYLGGQWFLEIAPTYRYTIDGKKKSWVHESQLSGIKRLEGNRAVLSQILLWSSVLSAAAPEGGPHRLLNFGSLPTFTVERPIADESLVPIESVNDGGATNRVVAREELRLGPGRAVDQMGET